MSRDRKRPTERLRDRGAAVLAGLRRRSRHIIRIARWEIDTSTGTLDRRTAVAFGLAALFLLAAAPALLSGSVALDEGIYRVAIDDDHEYYPAVREDAALRPVEPSEDADIVVTEDGVRPGDLEDSPGGARKSNAAFAELRSAIENYNNQQLDDERNQSAAFPVVVELRHEARQTDRGGISGPPGSGTDAADGGAGVGDGTNDDSDGTGGTEDAPDGTDDANSDNTDGPADDESRDDGTDGSNDGSGGSNDGSDEDSSGTDNDGGESTGDSGDGDGASGDDSGLPPEEDSTLPGVGGGLFEQGQVGTPADIDPPFPFEPLILAFLFIIPMNFVIQAYGSTIINERLNRRGELLLVAPVSPAAIVTGKTLPYFGVLLATTVAIAALVHGGALALVGGGLLSVLAVVPLAMLFLAATFVAGMFARSYKELTFVTVTISVFLTTYAFVPAIFTDVTPIALISPLTIVVRDLQGVGVSAVEYGFSTGPVYLSSLVLFALGLGVYREEDMFTQRKIHLKAIDAFAAHVHRPRHVFVVTAFLIPFVLLLQLLSIAVLFVLPLRVGLVFVLVLGASVEEVAKSVHVFAGYEHDRFDRAVPMALLLGLLSGAGFFVAEKVAHVGQLVGLDDIELGRALFQIGFDLPTLLAVLLFFLPLVLHVVTATIAIAGARSSPVRYVLALGVAIVVHVAYNLGVLFYVA